MALRAKFESSCDIGVYTTLTNTYCLVPHAASENYYSVFEAECEDYNMPVVRTHIAGAKVVGSCTVGNRHGLLVPATTTDVELRHLRNSLPDTVIVQRVEERLSAFGNVIACNDYVALAHMDLDKETEEIIQDVLKVEVFRTTVNNELLVGQHCVFTNRGGLVHPSTPVKEINSLSQLLQVPLAPGTINSGSSKLAAGILVNDFLGFVGYDSTATEIAVLERVCQLQGRNRNKTLQGSDNEAD